jgi:hypothetical protein
MRRGLGLAWALALLACRERDHRASDAPREVEAPRIVVPRPQVDESAALVAVPTIDARPPAPGGLAEQPPAVAPCDELHALLVHIGECRDGAAETLHAEATAAVEHLARTMARPGDDRQAACGFALPTMRWAERSACPVAVEREP